MASGVALSEASTSMRYSPLTVEVSVKSTTVTGALIILSDALILLMVADKVFSGVVADTSVPSALLIFLILTLIPDSLSTPDSESTTLALIWNSSVVMKPVGVKLPITGGILSAAPIFTVKLTIA